MVGFLVAFLISLTLSVVSYLLTPKPKTSKPASAEDLDDPTSDAGREMSVPFGDITIKSGNILWFGEKSVKQYKVKV